MSSRPSRPRPSTARNARTTSSRRSPSPSPTEAISTSPAPSRRRTTAAPSPGTDPVRTHFLDVPFNERTWVRNQGARWDDELRRWLYRGALPERLLPYSSRAHTWERWQEDDYNGTPATNQPGTGVELRAHQQQAADCIAEAFHRKQPGFLLADDVGLGKTFSAIAAFSGVAQPLKIAILCPLSVAAHWRRSIELFGSGPHRWCVINYDRTKQLLTVPPSAHKAKRARTRNQRIAKDGIPKVEFDVVICDESHRLKNPASQRSKAVHKLVAHGQGAFTLWMSATAGQNPLELGYLAPLLAHRSGQPLTDFAEFDRWCTSQGIGVRRGPYGSWVWDRNPDDLDTINSLLFDSHRYALRRRPVDIDGWPELLRCRTAVELDTDQTRLYQQAWTVFCRELDVRSSGSDSNNPMVAALRFRQKASLLRTRQTVDMARDLIDDGFQVAISTQFVDTAQRVASALGCEVISGEVSASEREDVRRRFQRGDHRAVVFTVTEGISLHAGDSHSGGNDISRVLLIHDVRWSALDMAQIEGRCHRDGQQAVAHYVYAADTVESGVVDTVVERLDDMATMLGDDPVVLDYLVRVAGSSAGGSRSPGVVSVDG